MINEDAINKAKDIPEDQRRSKTIENLEETTKIFNDSSKRLDKELQAADKAFYTLVESAPPEHQQKAIKTVQQAKALLEELKKGAKVEDIVKKLNNLSNAS